MADASNQDAPPPDTAEAPDANFEGNSINDQVTDAVAEVTALAEGLGPSTAAAMLGVMGADSIALAMLNAVARQQADATIASAALAAACARIAGTSPPRGNTPPASAAQFVAATEAQAVSAVMLLKSQADHGGELAQAARESLARIAACAAPPPRPKRAPGGKGAGAAA
ncbi:MAG TPA: RebB family R body protein [Allosphingosinicella sp.]|jgi:hypothetical protein